MKENFPKLQCPFCKHSETLTELQDFDSFQSCVCGAVYFLQLEDDCGDNEGDAQAFLFETGQIEKEDDPVDIRVIKDYDKITDDEEFSEDSLNAEIVGAYQTAYMIFARKLA